MSLIDQHLFLHLVYPLLYSDQVMNSFDSNLQWSHVSYKFYILKVIKLKVDSSAKFIHAHVIPDQYKCTI